MVLCTLLLAGCGRTGSAPGSQAAKAGTPPRRIVSLTPSNTEILFSLGLGDRVVGDTSWCDYPPEAKRKPKVGDVNISLERVVALRPDLVLAHSTLNRSVIERLRSLKIRVVSTDPKTFADVMSDLRMMGRVTGTDRQAERLVRSMEDAVSKVRKQGQSGRRQRVLVVIQTSPLWAAGPGTFVDEMIGCTNGDNIAHDARPGFNPFSTESAIARNPDVIVVTRPEDKAFFEKNPLWKRTGAVHDGRIAVLDPALLLRPGPRLAQGLHRLAEALSR